MATNLAEHIPALRYKSLGSVSWTGVNNTETVTDARVKPSSIILLMPTSVPAGRLAVTTLSDGSFVITSSASENGLTISYLIL